MSIKWWHRWRLQATERDWIEATGVLVDLDYGECSIARMRAKYALEEIEVTLRHHRIKLGLDPQSGL